MRKLQRSGCPSKKERRRSEERKVQGQRSPLVNVHCGTAANPGSDRRVRRKQAENIRNIKDIFVENPPVNNVNTKRKNGKWPKKRA